MFRDGGSPARLAWQESGLGDFVTKPVDLVVLTRLLEQLTGTGLPSGAAIEDEYVSGTAERGTPPSRDRLEFVMPDVDRILTEPEAQAALASAIRVCAAADAASVPPGPATGSGAPAPGDGPGDAVGVTVPAQGDAPPAGPAPTAQPVVEVEAGALPEEAGEADAPPAAAVGTLLPVDVVPIGAMGPGDAVQQENAVALEGGGEAGAESQADPAPAGETGPSALALATPEPPAPRAEAASGEAGEVGPSASSVREPARLEVVETPAKHDPSAQEPTAALDPGRLELASMGLPGVRKALLNAFLGELSPFLEKLSWTLSDADAQSAAAEAHGLAALSRSVGAIACAEALEELERRAAEGGLKASDLVLRRCYAQGHGAVTEARALLAEERRAA